MSFWNGEVIGRPDWCGAAIASPFWDCVAIADKKRFDGHYLLILTKIAFEFDRIIKDI